MPENGAQQDIEINYLPRQSSRDVYLYLDAESAAGTLRFEPAYYRLD